MSTYLELVKDAARESGTVPGYSAISSAVGQTGRVALFAAWVNQAYRDIQNKRDDWRWLTAEFEGTAINGVDTFAASDLSIDVDRFSHWIIPNDGLEHFTCYPTADGVSEEAFLIQRTWQDFRRRFKMGTEAAVAGRPSHFAISPRDEVVLYPIPDADHVLKGSYYKGPQVLAADSDIPEMPRRYHDAIMWGALVHMCTYDESFAQIQIYQGRYDMALSSMISENTPEITLAGPLA